jgi:CheY-like chemotaxis protein/anti-sigma regulatory factor (Ser/Thr protein kinase)
MSQGGLDLEDLGFLAHISHELRTPLNAILGMTELTLDTELTAKQRQYLEAVKANAENLLVLITDILDVSKIAAGQMEFERVPSDLVAVVEDVVESLSVPAARKGLRLLADLDPDLPNPVASDAGRFRQIVTNLLGNAVKYTEAGHVVVRLVRAPGGVGLEVLDTGPGIAPADQERIFQRFVRLSTPAVRRTSGTGLGLAITRSLVELMGGELRLESAPGRGSHFIVTLPAEQVPGPPVWAPLPGGLNLVVADPEEARRRSLVQWLRRAGNRVQEAGSGVALMALLNARPLPQAVVVDEELRRPDPHSLLEVARSDHAFRSVRFVLLTNPARAIVEDDERFDAVLHRAPRRHALAAALQATKLEARAPDQEYTPVVAPARRHRPQSSHDGPGPLRRSGRILLVDDSTDNQALVTQWLDAEGHQVIAVGDGHLGVSVARQQRFDLVLMDLHMPVMDGFEATATLRSDEVLAQRPRVPIVAVTAHSTDQVRQKCLKVGMDDFLSKPLTRERLLAQVRRWVRQVTRLLVVDDDPSSRLHLSEVLLAHGAEVVPVGGVREAAAALPRESFDLVLSDLRLSEGSGLDLLPLAAAEGIPVVMITGQAESLSALIRRGAAGALAKPVRAAALVEEVHRVLRGGAAGVATSVDPDIADLVPGYLASRRFDVGRLRAWLDAGNYAEIARLGHSVKGTGVSYGFPELSGWGERLEAAANLRSEEQVAAGLRELEDFLARAGR